MWVDEHGSEILSVPECRRLLAEAVTAGRHGHLGVSSDGAPVVLPVDFAVLPPDVLIRVGPGLRDRMADRLVAFQVDDVQVELTNGGGTRWHWSVLVRGLATPEASLPSGLFTASSVHHPGDCPVRIRADRVTGRRLAVGESGRRPAPELHV